ncbi:MAG: hypothetical protein AAGI71_19425 [Bacteroidota bacterium]
MDDIAARLEAYPFLPPDAAPAEHDTLAAWVATHPAWASAWQQAQAARDTVEMAAPLFREPIDDEGLATYLTARIGPHAPPPVLRPRLEILDARLQADAALRRRADVIRGRLEAADRQVRPWKGGVR